MTMNSVCYKEHDVGSGLNPMASPSRTGPWWNGLVTRSPLEESVQVKTRDAPKLGDITPKALEHGADQVLGKRDITQFNIMTGKVLNIFVFSPIYSPVTSFKYFGFKKHIGFTLKV